MDKAHNRKSHIVVDADACPVKPEIIQAGTEFNVPVLMVASYDHQIEESPGVCVQYVDRSDQSVDLYISNYIQAGDVLITQDIGLAAIGLAKRAWVLSERGQLHTNEMIGYLMERRHANAKKRRGGGRHKGPRPFASEDRNIFLQALTKILTTMQESEHT